jgi:hypothetical protein
MRGKGADSYPMEYVEPTDEDLELAFQLDEMVERARSRSEPAGWSGLAWMAVLSVALAAIVVALCVGQAATAAFARVTSALGAAL